MQTEALEKEMNPEEYKQFKEDANDSLDTKAETKTILDSIDEGVLLHSMTPSQYFRKIKELQVSINSDTLQDTINVASDILDKLRRSGQKPLAEKLMRKSVGKRVQDNAETRQELANLVKEKEEGKEI